MNIYVSLKYFLKSNIYNKNEIIFFFYFYLFHSEIIKLRIFKINNFIYTLHKLYQPDFEFINILKTLRR